MKTNNLIKICCLSVIFIFIFFLFVEDPVGVLSLILIVFLSSILINKYPPITNLLITALAIRIFVLFLGNIIDLPDSGKDAVFFETRGFLWSQDGFLTVLIEHYPGANSVFLSWMYAILYSLFGRSLLMVQSLSLLFGMGSIFLGWLIAKKIWDDSKALKVGWFLALFPSLILYSVLTMREVYISFFFLVAIFGIVSWYRTPSLKWIVLGVFGFVAGSFFHGAMSIGALVFIFFIALNSFKRIFKSFLSNRIDVKNFIVASTMIVILTLYFTNKIGVPKIGKFRDSIDISRLATIMKSSSRGDASYPDWIQINSTSEFFYKGPIRAIYFIFSPFPWDVKKTKHLIGSMDSFLYMILFYFILRNRKVIWKEPDLRVILFILFSYFFVFGIGVGNFGTGIRHRAKFVVALILLAAPFFPKIVLSTKRKLGKYIW